MGTKNSGRASLNTTQQYYRVSEKRKREAVERVTTMQFDRKGNRVWREAQRVLDSEHTRRAVGEVQVPYGLCTEPSNVAAGGHDCPVRFRCVGCSHFRTDVSYLPDLEAYLADLLRGRERLAAFAADSWAKAEAMPSDEEITRVRRLVKRVRDELEDLTDEDKLQIQDAVTSSAAPAASSPSACPASARPKISVPKGPPDDQPRDRREAGRLGLPPRTRPESHRHRREGRRGHHRLRARPSGPSRPDIPLPPPRPA
ncbi:hypothetical protein [Streptomyces sp. ISL-44]|uniref:hypothetical protein n=1 Tax=Streptomyces sp. ISL-44 TaxID=2819184 RepID=UPI002035A042|nr:hypothetical protein [Streptomyces sp. ISL-44]